MTTTHAAVVAPVAVQEVATLTRASVGTCWDVTGSLVTKAVDEARYNWRPSDGTFEGVLWEPARTNLFLNSTTLATQSRTVTAGTTYTVSFYGSGQLTISGNTTVDGVVASTRVMSGTGPTARTGLTLVAGTTTLVFTVSGSVTKAQLEAGGFATSWITTAGASATRAAETFSGAGMFNTTFTDATADYSAVTTYALGSRVKKDRRIFESLDGGNLNNTPVATADTYHPRITYPSGAVVLYEGQVYTSLTSGNVGNQPDETPASWKAWWLNVAPTNDFACFDRMQGVPSVGANGEQVFAFYAAEEVNAVVLFGVQADTVHIAISNGAGGLATRSVTVAGGVAVALDMAVPGGTVGGAVVSVFAHRATGVVVIGEFIAGTQHGLGATRFGFNYSIKDWSERRDDEVFGDSTFVRRGYAKQLAFDVEIDTPDGNEDLNNIAERLEYLRATPTAWVVTHESKWARVSVVYGTYKSFRVVVPYASVALCAIELDGLIQTTT